MLLERQLERAGQTVVILWLCVCWFPQKRNAADPATNVRMDRAALLAWSLNSQEKHISNPPATLEWCWLIRAS